MSPDDPRHGTYAGHVAGCRLHCCGSVKLAYDKRRKLDVARGLARKVPAWRAIRRVQALQRLGWSVPRISDVAELYHQQVYDLDRYPTCYATTFAAIERAYDALSMALPATATTGQRISVTRAQRAAERNGYLPPLAWLNIDDPNERPDLSAIDHEPDPVVVERILAGDWRLKATPAERAEVVARWTGSRNELERRTGWNVYRDAREGSAA